jgi:hypothetical protein
MTADFSPNLLETYIVAQYAQWAGDYAYATQLLAELQLLPFEGPLPRSVSDNERVERNLTHQDDILRVAAAPRARALRERIEQFGRLREGLPAPYNAVSHTPLVLTGRHLRGTIWRTAVREFRFRCYLLHLSEEQGFLRQADALCQRNEGEQEELIDAEPGTAQLPEFRGRDVSWVMPGNPFVNVTVSELCLAQALLLWVDRTPPETIEPIQRVCQKLLDELDPPSSSLS